MRVALWCLSFFASVNLLAQAKTYDFPNPVDTEDRPIVYQEKKTFLLGNGLFVDNQFDGARMNGVKMMDDSSIVISIEPENTPINPSPWYAFRLWTSDAEKRVSVTIRYPKGHKHRYWPKESRDGLSWTPVEQSDFQIADDSLSILLSTTVRQDTTWISAQPLETSAHVKSWCLDIADHKSAVFETIGESIRGGELYHMRLGKGKKVVVLLSRQHPPEVTGYYALKSFVNKIMDSSKTSKKFLKKHTVLVYPLLNPDGVDLGHWRHNTGGVDLNRDWASYRQLEVRQVADHIVNYIEESDADVILGLDFHSTYGDVYYTTDRSIPTVNQDFQDRWLKYIDENLEDYQPNDQPSGLGSPVSKGWFVSQFNAPGVVFEFGDTKSLEFIREKGKVSAEGMMNVLLKPQE